MRDHVWWKHLHWFEYGAELLGTAFLVFAGLSAVVFDLGAGSPLAHILPDMSIRRRITGLWFAGSGALVARCERGGHGGADLFPGHRMGVRLHGMLDDIALRGQ